MPGPVPKPSASRRRTNTPVTAISKAPAAPPVPIPAADPNWHSIAIEWFESLGKSGQHIFFQPSDWAQARYIAELMSRNLHQGGKVSSQLAATVLAGATELLTTEGARRRLRIELERGEGEQEAQVIDYRSRARNTARG